MPSSSSKILQFIRHAPSQPPGYLYGQTDADIGTIEAEAVTRLQRLIGEPGAIYCSPAQRCQKTADAIISHQSSRHTAPDLWEQSFGAWDGLAFDAIPDMGTMTDEALTSFAAPDGESFSDLCQRVHPFLTHICETSTENRLTFFVHAGVIRAALALAFGHLPAALKCEIDTLSVTKMRYLGPHGFSVISVNQTGTL